MDVGGLKIGNPAWGPRENMAEIGNVAVSAKLLPLLSGRRGAAAGPGRSGPTSPLLRDAQGRANWTFEPPRREPAKPFKLPPIQTFIINDGRLRMVDQGRKLTFAGDDQRPRGGAARPMPQGFQPHRAGRSEPARLPAQRHRRAADQCAHRPALSVRRRDPRRRDPCHRQGPGAQAVRPRRAGRGR